MPFLSVLDLLEKRGAVQVDLLKRLRASQRIKAEKRSRGRHHPLTLVCVAILLLLLRRSDRSSTHGSNNLNSTRQLNARQENQPLLRSLQLHCAKKVTAKCATTSFEMDGRSTSQQGASAQVVRESEELLRTACSLAFNLVAYFCEPQESVLQVSTRGLQCNAAALPPPTATVLIECCAVALPAVSRLFHLECVYQSVTRKCMQNQRRCARCHVEVSEQTPEAARQSPSEEQPQGKGNA